MKTTKVGLVYWYNKWVIILKKLKSKYDIFFVTEITNLSLNL